MRVKITLKLILRMFFSVLNIFYKFPHSNLHKQNSFNSFARDHSILKYFKNIKRRKITWMTLAETNGEQSVLTVARPFNVAPTNGLVDTRSTPVRSCALSAWLHGEPLILFRSSKYASNLSKVCGEKGLRKSLLKSI